MHGMHSIKVGCHRENACTDYLCPKCISLSCVYCQLVCCVNQSVVLEYWDIGPHLPLLSASPSPLSWLQLPSPASLSTKQGTAPSTVHLLDAFSKKILVLSGSVVHKQLVGMRV